MQQGHRGFLPIRSHVLESAGQQFGDGITNWVLRNDGNSQTVVMCEYVLFKGLCVMLYFNDLFYYSGILGFPLPLREIVLGFRFSKI
jgi:hypothetical protein